MASSDSKTIVVQGGLGLLPILFLIFLVLQLAGVIDWPWYAVTVPLLIAWGIGLAFALLFVVLAIVAAISRG